MDWSYIHGALAFTAFLLAWASGSNTTLKFALLLLAEWILSNVIVAYMGFARAPEVLPELCGILAIILAVVADSERSLVGIVLFGLMLAAMIFDPWSYQQHTQGSRNYYIVLNGGFAIRAVIVGFSGVRYGVARWLRGGYTRPGHSPVRRAGVVAGVAKWTT